MFTLSEQEQQVNLTKETMQSWKLNRKGLSHSGDAVLFAALHGAVILELKIRRLAAVKSLGLTKYK